MKRTTQISPDRLRLLIVDRDMSFDEAADALGVSKGTVSGLCHRHGIKRPKPQSQPEQAR